MAIGKTYVIPFSGLKEGGHRFEFQIEQSFFEAFAYEDFSEADIQVALLLHKKSTLLELEFKSTGTVGVLCDLTSEPYCQLLEGYLNLVIKFGETFNDDNDDILILPQGAYEVDVSQYIYEMIVLSVPSKRIHPGIKNGTLRSDILDRLEELQPNNRHIKTKEDIDPRWDALKTLRTEK